MEMNTYFTIELQFYWENKGTPNMWVGKGNIRITASSIFFSFLFLSFFFFFFSSAPEVCGSSQARNCTCTRQSSEPLQCHYQILNSLSHQGTPAPFILFIYLFIYLLFTYLFLGLNPRHTEVPRLGNELQL